MKIKVWELFHFIDHIVEEDPYDAKLTPPLDDHISRFGYFDRENSQLCNPFYFSTIFDNLEYIDFVYNDQDWLIFSDDAVKLLNLHSNEYYQIHDTIMIDSKIRSDDPRISRDFGCLDCIQYALERPHLTRTDYKVISMKPIKNAVDLDDSEYKLKSSGKGVSSIDKLVLNEREGGYPPIFRIAELPARLYITQEAREKLKQAGITGPAYYPVDGSMWSREVDNPIIFPEIEA